MVRASNRTKVELKPREARHQHFRLIFQSNQSGIETTNKILFARRWHLPIEPKWNWNGRFARRFWICSYLPIEPKWNWNLYAIIVFYGVSCFQSNQSGIETDLSQFFHYRNGLPIEPKWNWNIFTFGQLIQSDTSNRTKVELKLELVFRNLSFSHFQSNQSGIETCDLLHVGKHLELPIEPKWNWNSKYETLIDALLTSNRTKVELKQRISWFVIVGICFQSNQSGIETRYRYGSHFCSELPIEPKWNWNGRKQTISSSPSASNRTKVELKRWSSK